jgi:integrase
MQVLRDSSEVIEEYLMVMRREINCSKEYERLTRSVLSKIDVMTATQTDIIKFLDSLRKPESVDPMHKWIGSYNLYIAILKRFFKWLNNPYCMEGIKKLKRKEVSIYKPSDLWTQEDDLLFLKFCTSKRDKCYHMISRDTSCRPSEILRIKCKEICFKMIGNRQYAEVLVNGKTGSRHIPLINSLPYVKDYLDDHVSDPNSYLIRSKKFGKLNSSSLNVMPEKKVFNGQTTERISHSVINVDDRTAGEKTLSLTYKQSQPVEEPMEQGYTVMDITKVGEGFSLSYEIKPIE